MNINEAFPSNYLKAADLQGRSTTVKIDHVAFEKIGDDRKAILYFIGKEKGMVLNKTNANTITGMFGAETDGWHGVAIELFAAWVDFQGKQVEALRIRPPRARPPQQQAQPAAPAPQIQPQGNPAGYVFDPSIPYGRTESAPVNDGFADTEIPF